MSLTDDSTNGGSASAPAPTPYAFLIIAFVLQFLRLAIDLDMLDMFCSFTCKHGQIDFHVFSHIMFTVFMD
jgi:hypothetical protein